MIGGNGGVNPSSDSQTLNVCDGGLFLSLRQRGKGKVLPRYIDAFFHLWGEAITERAPRKRICCVVSGPHQVSWEGNSG